MPGKTRKHSRHARIQLKTISLTKACLQKLPEKKELLSLREAIHQLRVPLETALTKGYNYQELATMLQQQGVSVSASILKNYLASVKQEDSRSIASSKLKNNNSETPLENPSSSVEVFIPAKTETSSYTVGRDFWSAYQESLKEREEVYRRLAGS